MRGGDALLGDLAARLIFTPHDNTKVRRLNRFGTRQRGGTFRVMCDNCLVVDGRDVVSQACTETPIPYRYINLQFFDHVNPDGTVWAGRCGRCDCIVFHAHNEEAP